MPSPEESRVLREVARTWLPRDGAIAVDAVDARVDVALDAWIDGLPIAQRTVVSAALRAVENGHALGTGRPGVRFTDALPEDRRAWLDNLLRGRFGAPLRWVRRAAVAAWVHSPAVRAHMPIGALP